MNEKRDLDIYTAADIAQFRERVLAVSPRIKYGWDQKRRAWWMELLHGEDALVSFSKRFEGDLWAAAYALLIEKEATRI